MPLMIGGTLELVLLLCILQNLNAFTASPKTTLLQRTTKTRSYFQLHSTGTPLVDKIRFLGRGSNAIVRPGVVLVAPVHEYNHFLMKAAVFVYAMGLDDHDEYVIRGVIIDHPTPFTMEEMGTGVVGPLADNFMFRGGDGGADPCLMLSSRRNGDEIGTSGIYEGGLEAATQACMEEIADPSQFKFFFNYCQFNEVQLEQMLAEEDSEGDAWTSVEIVNDPAFVLSSEWERGDAWSRLRNAMNQMNV